MNPFEIILQSLDIFIEDQYWPELKPSEILRILMYTLNKGWLYTPTVEGKVQCIICAYRIKEGDDLYKIPLKDEGNILYIPFFLSLNKEKNLYKVVRESLKLYLENNPDITEMLLEDKNKKIKRYSLKGEKNGVKQKATATNTAILSN